MNKNFLSNKGKTQTWLYMQAAEQASQHRYTCSGILLQTSRASVGFSISMLNPTETQ